jgi:hypothetical protein
LNGTAVDLMNAAIDLPPPAFFAAFVDGLIKALDERVDERGARFGREGESISEYFDSLPFHKVILQRIRYASVDS